MKIHELKTWPDYFFRVFAGQKNFEIRKNDRDFQIGDTLVLREWSPDTKEYTGREVNKEVTYILHGGNFGIEAGYCILSLQ